MCEVCKHSYYFGDKTSKAAEGLHAAWGFNIVLIGADELEQYGHPYPGVRLGFIWRA
jgi:hypothetical protein